MKDNVWFSYLTTTIRENPQLQTWKGHLDVRIGELSHIARIADFGQVDSLLEVGCGNALGSAFFANRARRIVATDLPDVDHVRHAIGLEKPRRLFESLGITHAETLGCSGEQLPFADGSFDVILSMYSLEHIRGRGRCVAECRRVLRPGGRLIAAVPASAWSVFYPIEFYYSMGQRALSRLAERDGKKAKTASADGAGGFSGSAAAESARVVKDWKSFRKVYPDFPLPKPHGEYSSYWSELWSQRPAKWVELCHEGGFLDVDVFPISVIPTFSFRALLGGVGEAIHRRLREWDRALVSTGALVPFSQLICLVCKVPEV